MELNPVLIFGDTETSGLEPEDRIVQIAFSYIDKPHSNYGNSFFLNPKRYTFDELCNPGIDINPEASQYTGIFDCHVKNKKKLSETQSFKTLNKLLAKDNTYFIAYNAPFDVDMLEKDGLFIPTRKIIDLYRIVKHLYKDHKIKNRNGDDVPLANNKMQYFRGLLKFDEQEDFHSLVKEYGLDSIQSHTALSDVVVLEYFYHYICQEFNLSFEEMLKLSNTPVLEPFITFGNVFEKGTPFEVCFSSTYEQYGRMKNGYDYLDWVSNNLTLSVDTKWSLKIHFFNALVSGTVPFNEKFLKYLNYGLIFEKNPDKIEKALSLLNKEESYIFRARKEFISNLEVEVEELINAELGDRFPSLFLLNYLNTYFKTNENEDFIVIEEPIHTDIDS